MDIPSIAVHLAPLLAVREISFLPARLVFLADAVQQQINTEKMDFWFGFFMKQNDLEASCASAGAGITSIWDSGYDYGRYTKWFKRAQILLAKRNNISPLAVASLYGFKALIELTGPGDVQAAKESYEHLRLYAEKAASPSLRLFYAAAISYCLLWMGKLAEIEMILDDAGVFLADAETSIVCKIYFQTTVSLFHAVRGEIEKAEQVIMEIINLPFFELLPPPAYFLAYGHLLYAISHKGLADQIEEIAQRVRTRAIPEQNYFHYSYLHFSLGIAYLLTGQPHKALIHSNEAVERGRLSGSQIAERMPALLHGQALSDLNRDREALEHFLIWIDKWLKGGFNIIAAAGAIELAHLYAKKGHIERARIYYEKASQVMPQGENVPSLYRSARFMENLRRRIYHQSPVAEIRQNPENTPVQIETFGELKVRIGAKTIYDRHWKGRTTKNLLKALIVYGCSKISADLLIDTLWPDAEADHAANNLKVAISRLKKLGCPEGEDPLPWIVVRHKHISLSRDLCTVDTLLFQEALSAVLKEKGGAEELIKVLDLYKEDFLVNDNSTIWVIRHREFLREKFIKGVFALFDKARGIDDLEIVIPHLLKASAKDPLNEEVYARLMRAQIKMGYISKAMQTYRQAEEILKKELDIRPGPALQSLVQSIRQHS